ncbi:MAG: hypothetical protein ACKOAH_33435, partial [Pirellula sp.]
DLLGVVGRYGDRAMDFIWRNKLTLAGGTALAAFVANPEPFLDGTRELVEKSVDSLASNVGKPIAEQMGTARSLCHLFAIVSLRFLYAFGARFEPRVFQAQNRISMALMANIRQVQSLAVP